MKGLICSSGATMGMIIAFVVIGIIALGIIFGIIAIVKKIKKSSSMIDGYTKLTIGMSKQEVLAILGNPTGVRKHEGIETLTWKHSEHKGFLRGGTMVRTIIADFEEEKLTGYDSDNMDRSRL